MGSKCDIKIGTKTVKEMKIGNAVIYTTTDTPPTGAVKNCSLGGKIIYDNLGDIIIPVVNFSSKSINTTVQNNVTNSNYISYPVAITSNISFRLRNTGIGDYELGRDYFIINASESQTSDAYAVIPFNDFTPGATYKISYNQKRSSAGFIYDWSSDNIPRQIATLTSTSGTISFTTHSDAIGFCIGLKVRSGNDNKISNVTITQ